MPRGETEESPQKGGAGATSALEIRRTTSLSVIITVYSEAISLHVLASGVITHLSDVLDAIKCRPSYSVTIIFHFLWNTKKTKNKPVHHE